MLIGSSMTRGLVLILIVLLVSPGHAAQQKVLRYAFEVAETGFDPAQISDLYSRYVTAEIFEAPLRRAYLAAPGTLELATASEMPEVSADFRTFTFHLKPGIYFANDPAFGGKRRELVAEDYVYTYKRFFDPHWNSPVAGTLEPVDIVGMKELRSAAIKSGHFDYDQPIEGLRTLDRYSFQIRLGTSQPRFVDFFADGSQFGALARDVVEKYGDSIGEHPVGTGGFRLAQWRRSSLIVLEKNPDYRLDVFHVTPDVRDADAQRVAKLLEGRRLPILDRVEVSIIEESQPRWLSFVGAEFDYLERMPPDFSNIALPGNRLAPNLVNQHIHVERVPWIDVTEVLFNMDDPVIGGYTPAKVALRRAIGLGIDNPEIIRSYLKGQAFAAQSIIMPDTFAYDPDLRTDLGVTDLARAKAILDEFGYRLDSEGQWRTNPDGSALAIEILTQPDQRSRILEEIYKKSFDRLQLRTEFRVAKWPEQLKAVRAGKYMMWSAANSGLRPDPSQALLMAYGPASGSDNLSRFKLPEYDSLYREQNSMADGPERIAIIRRMQQLLVAYEPMKYPAHRYAINMYRDWVKNYRRWPFVLDFWRYLDIDVDEQKGSRKN